MTKITVAVGDIHGCLDELHQLMEHVKKHVDVVDRWVFLGDYVDRGPKTKDVINFLMTLDDGNNVFLRGNHEDMMLWQSPNYIHKGMLNGFQNWMINGGDQTILSYGFPFSPEFWNPLTPMKVYDAYKHIDPKHIDWISKTKLYFNDSERTYVHAGINRKLPLTEQSPNVLTWIRDEFLNNVSPKGGYVVHGHTPGPKVELRPNRCNLDTACVYGGTLSAGIFDESKSEPRTIVNHKGKVTHDS